MGLAQLTAQIEDHLRGQVRACKVKMLHLPIVLHHFCQEDRDHLVQLARVGHVFVCCLQHSFCFFDVDFIYKSSFALFAMTLVRAGVLLRRDSQETLRVDMKVVLLRFRC